jgi:chorismate synthase
MKYELPDVRDVLERASARETSARVAVGALCKDLLDAIGIAVHAHVVRVGAVAAPSYGELGPGDFAALDGDARPKRVATGPQVAC